ncbi:MAG TPA: four helix bundle protein [Candidatus Sulfotelmatobacter sp.]|nr:four helix bundle protein [Candidatus Sulfotelmatobacter sp.]
MTDQKGNDQKEKVYDLRARLLLFSGRVLRVCGMLPYSPEAQVLRRQLARAGTAIGANFEEADGALTRKDFINKLAIARKEAKEAKYWLSIAFAHYLKTKGANIELDIEECEEIIKILSAILKKVGHKFRI